MSGEFNGKEEKAKEIKSKKSEIFTRKNFRDMLYGFLVIFLLLLVYVAGQMQTTAMIAYVDKMCPGAQVISASPFSGLVVMPPGGHNISVRHSELGYDMVNFSAWNFSLNST